MESRPKKAMSYNKYGLIFKNDMNECACCLTGSGAASLFLRRHVAAFP